MLIELTQDKFAIINDEDYELISQYKWCARKNRNHWYAQTHIYRLGKRTTISMHTLLVEKKSGYMIDHINRNGLDNRRENLRLATNRQNQGNREKLRGTSQYKGVRRCTDCNRWRASIKSIHLGLFSSEEEAAKAYDKAAKEYYGEFAKLNFVEGR